MYNTHDQKIIGQKIIELLGLKEVNDIGGEKPSRPCYNTSDGPKTAWGIYLSVLNLINEPLNFEVNLKTGEITTTTKPARKNCTILTVKSGKLTFHPDYMIEGLILDLFLLPNGKVNLGTLALHEKI